MLDLKDNKGKIEDQAYKAKGGCQEVSDTGRVAGVAEAMKGVVQAVAADASDLVGKAKDTAQQMASSVGGAAVQAKDKAVEFTSAAVNKAGDIGQDVTALIRRYPFQSLLVGVGVGFLLAQLMRRS